MSVQLHAQLVSIHIVAPGYEGTYEIVNCTRPMLLGSLVSGQRLLATYVNYYTANKVVVVPQFGQPKWDAEAMKTLGALYPGREIIGVQSREILLGGGNIHCATHQVPLCQ